MPRQPRLDAPGALHHVMGRGIDGIKIFCNRKDRKDFLANGELFFLDLLSHTRPQVTHVQCESNSAPSSLHLGPDPAVSYYQLTFSIVLFQ